MPIDVQELEESRTFFDDEDRRNHRAERRYLCVGDADEGAVMTELINAIPPTLNRPSGFGCQADCGPLYRGPTSLRNQQASSVWLAVVQWLDASRVNDKQCPGAQPNFSFDTGNRRRTVYFGEPETGWPKTGNLPSDPTEQSFRGAVPAPFDPGPGGENDVAGDPDGLPNKLPNMLDLVGGRGQDVPVGSLNLREMAVFSADAVDSNYLETIAGLVGHLNDAMFRGYDRGSVLFLGASGQQPGGTQACWHLQFNFLFSPHIPGVEVLWEEAESPNPPKTIIFKEVGGHDYVQILTRPEIPKEGFKFNRGQPDEYELKVPIKRNYAALLHKIYPDGNFNLLGIGN